MNLLILGANSDMARAIAAKFAKEKGAALYLASRDTEKLARDAKDLEIRYSVKITVLKFDAEDFNSHAAFYADLDPKPDGVVVAFGYLGDQRLAQHDFREAKRVIDVNFMGAMSVLELAAADFERLGRGFIIGISSVAGDRGRQSNYVYGAAKGAFTIYLAGLRNRLFKSGVRVLTVLPGYTRTKMTEGLDLPDRLTASPEEVADDIYKAWKKGRDIIYTKWMWRYVMLIIKSIPEVMFKKMGL